MTTSAKTARLCLAVFALAALPLLAWAGTPEEFFKAQTDAWKVAYNSGKPENAATIVAMYTNDAVMMPPDAPAATGHDAMTAFISKDMAATHDAGMSLRMDADSAGSSGDLGWHSGAFSVIDKDGTAVATGKFVEVWQKQADGKWLMIRDMWSNDAPAPAAPPAAEKPAG